MYACLNSVSLVYVFVCFVIVVLPVTHTVGIFVLLCNKYYSFHDTIYSKTCVKRPLKNRHNKGLMTNGSFLQVESIAECSPFAIHLTCIKR